MNHFEWTNQLSALTAHGLGGVDLLTDEELLQLPDVHPGLGHGLQVPPALGGTCALRGALTWRRREQQRGAGVEETHAVSWWLPDQLNVRVSCPVWHVVRAPPSSRTLLSLSSLLLFLKIPQGGFPSSLKCVVTETRSVSIFRFISPFWLASMTSPTRTDTHRNTQTQFQCVIRPSVRVSVPS